MYYSTLKDVQKYFPIEDFRDFQQEIIESILAERDVMAIIPTGGGKSLCYQYPAVVLPGVTIVVSPLIALMNDQVKHLNERNIKAACLTSEVDKKEQWQIMLDAVEGKYKLLYVSPERLISPAFTRFAERLSISLLVIDEAHCISLWGYDFRPGFLKILQFLKRIEHRPPIAAFTATATEYMKQDMVRILNLKNPFVVNAGYNRENISLSVVACKNNSLKRQKLYRYLDKNKERCGIIYCATVLEVEELYDRLAERQYVVSRYYAGLPDEEKRKSFESFMSGESQLMVATNAFGMGIDKSDVRFIIHYNLPANPETYYQQVGRAGRDGLPAEAILYHTGKDEGTCYGLLETQKESSHFEEELAEFAYQRARERLSYMIGYARNGDGISSEELAGKIRNYFEQFKPKEQEVEEGNRIQKKLLEEVFDIGVLYCNKTKVATLLRKGDYETGVENVVSIDKKSKLLVRFEIDNRLSYFDMMVADAVYTLEVAGHKKFYPKNVLECLSGDRDATLKPQKESEGKDKRTIIIESLERMQRTMIRIDRSGGMSKYGFPDERKLSVLTGAFLPIEKVGKNGYRLRETPPLYRYAELTNGQFFTFPNYMLLVKDEAGRKMPSSIENLMLRHYLARRCLLSNPYSDPELAKKNGVSPMSRMIKLVNHDRGRKGMFEILGISPDENPYLWKRRRKNLYAKIEMILNHYKSEKEIESYVWEQEEIKDSYDGVLLHFPISKRKI